MAYNEFLEKIQKDKTIVKVFLVGGTMLSGKINSFDDDCIVLDKCMVLRDQIISVVPQ